MSACDTCSKPGACCEDIPIFGVPLDMTVLEVLVLMAKHDHPKNPLPYLPFYNPRKRMVGTDHLPRQETWVLSCMNLGPDGRCMDYENRPHFPCGVYSPGEDVLCAQAVRKIGLCPDLKQPTPDFETYKASRS